MLNAADFRKRFFPQAARRDWDDWHWQIQNRFCDRKGLEAFLHLSMDEQKALDGQNLRLPVAVTPYYASLLDPGHPQQALRRTVIPVTGEWAKARGERIDPLGEDAHNPVGSIVHTYPDKVLFLVTDQCPSYCRFCTRSRAVGQGRFPPDRARWEEALSYIESTPTIRDVLLSGGEPLTLEDDRLEWLLRRLRRIPHVDLIRIGTKALSSLPQRVTPALAKMLRRYHPLWMSVHFVHPDELTPESARACARLVDAGIPLCSQTVLLKGVNDDALTLKQLMLGLLRFRVKPYYLHQGDAVAGTAHFRTSVARGQDLIRALHGHTTGYAVPAYMIDAPGGGGKVPVAPGYIRGRKGKTLLLDNYQGKPYRYTEGD
ncbi:MAG: lysine 2,3-aminomutase [Lentisphaerae bacterium GWF2_57_35]|nr:MAG: lysine 2,3-aminomutase [Lentisphaerae bacterium GWF2_57_35]